MASYLRLLGREPHVPAEIPRAGIVTSIVLSVITIVVLAVCLARRVLATKDWTKMPLTRWLMFTIYIDSILFIVTTMILEHGFGLNSTITICTAAIYLCLTCYMSTKFIYYFLVEKVYIIRRVNTPRLKSKLYLFNCFGMLLPYCAVVVLNFIYRIAYFDKSGSCIIGMELKAMMPLIIFDALVNFYLTLLFVIPLRNLYSYKNSPNSILRTVALRSFVGSLGTLLSSVVNLTVLMILRGEAAWICLMCCNADVLFSVLVLHWVTSKDSSSTPSSAHSKSGPKSNHTKFNPFGIYSKHGHENLGTVTTHITAMKTGDNIDEELELGGITVKVGHVVEIERDETRSHKSTEELVERP